MLRPAPQLREVQLSPQTWRRTYIESMMLLMLSLAKCGLIHGDASEYNMLWVKEAESTPPTSPSSLSSSSLASAPSLSRLINFAPTPLSHLNKEKRSDGRYHPYLIDWGQAVVADLTLPLHRKFLARDVCVLHAFFRKKGVATLTHTAVVDWMIACWRQEQKRVMMSRRHRRQAKKEKGVGGRGIRAATHAAYNQQEEEVEEEDRLWDELTGVNNDNDDGDDKTVEGEDEEGEGERFFDPVTVFLGMLDGVERDAYGPHHHEVITTTTTTSSTSSASQTVEGMTEDELMGLLPVEEDDEEEDGNDINHDDADDDATPLTKGVDYETYRMEGRSAEEERVALSDVAVSLQREWAGSFKESRIYREMLRSVHAEATE